MKRVTIAYLSSEMLLPELPEPARGAKFKGGLGILTGCTMEGLNRLAINTVALVPDYRIDWRNGQPIKTPSGKFIFETAFEGKPLIFSRVNQGRVKVYQVAHEIIDTPYNESNRIEQEVILAHSLRILLRHLNLKPDIVWCQEGHTALAFPILNDDPFFEGTKRVFTTHTPRAVGLERYPHDAFPRLKIDPGKYWQIFASNGCIDMTRAAMTMADAVTAVSAEHAETVRNVLYPDCSKDVVGILNGVSRKIWLSSRLARIPEAEFGRDLFWQVHQQDKKDLIRLVKGNTGYAFDVNEPVITLIRRFVDYKQQHPMFAPTIHAICANRGEEIQTCYGSLRGLGIQVLMGGWYHPTDYDRWCWIEDFIKWTNDPALHGNFVYLQRYDLELLEKTARGSDLCVECPMPYEESCGTSGIRCMTNGIPNTATRTGGPKQYVVEFNPETGEGNGFFIDPYHPLTLYEKLAIYSDLYYAWQEDKNDLLLKLMMNAFETGRALDIVNMIARYQEVFKGVLSRAA